MKRRGDRHAGRDFHGKVREKEVFNVLSKEEERDLGTPPEKKGESA